MNSITIFIFIFFQLFTELSNWEIFSPDQIHNAAGTIISSDYADPNFPIKGFNTSNGEHYKIRNGGGPGEVSNRGRKTISTFSNGDILIWDHGRAIAGVFTSDFQFKHYLNQLNYESTTGIYVLNDSTLVRFRLGGDICELIDVGIEHNKNTIIKSISTNDAEEFKPLEPWGWMRQLVLADAHNGELYFTFEYSSHVFKIDNTYSLSVIRDEKFGIDIPTRSRDDGNYLIPDSSTLPTAARSVHVNEDYVFVLLRTSVMSRTRQMRYTLNPDEYGNIIDHANYMMVIDRNTNEQIYKSLPKPYKSLTTIENQIVMLNTRGRDLVFDNHRIEEILD